ncbi:NAD-dependent protein deacetylase sirtuin-2-like isoform X2 [Dendronephthya gigantea]|uniref:NAD-dependent protein deacetylase sirtuin-2-like isoform X2 n=1 Tax=Dendronephthya gigantea TaxID=151771 RepID=UPI00106B90AB|nr:NAD-dependent protein deacetylase sirtuin-2-like isoform X2 [Dendronephthya gigantea]
MAVRISRFSGLLTILRQNNSAFHCLKAYKPSLKPRAVFVCVGSCSTYEVKPERLEEIARSPSGWVPPQNPPPSLPFQIRRSKTNNLPVYVDKKRGGSLVLTVIRNIKGDLNELVKMLKKMLGEDVHFQINEITSQVKIKELLFIRMSSHEEKAEAKGTGENSSDATSNAKGAEGAEGDSSSGDPDLPSFLQTLFARLGISKPGEQQQKEPEHEQVLDEVTFEGIAKYIQTGKCQNIVTMAGAGISTSAGIPDFRSPGSGLYDNLQQYNLPYPEAIFDISFFRSNPEPFFKLAKELYPGNFKPTTCHYFLHLLNEKGLLLRHYTQNIDTLERIAGVPGEKLVEAHGTFHTAHCSQCRKEYTQEWIKDQIFADNIPTCEGDCEGVVKPDIVFFGESLPDRFSRLLSQDMPKCDLLIIMGTSLSVQPFASLVDHVTETTPRLLINRDKCGQRGGDFSFMFGGGGLQFDHPKNYRDVAWLGSCDDGCLALAELLGWKEELVKLVKNEHEKIDKMAGKEDKEGKCDEAKALGVKDEVKTQGECADSQEVDEKRCEEQTKVSDTVNVEKNDVEDGSKSEPST